MEFVLKGFEGHNSYVTSVAFSPDGNFFVSVSWDGTVRFWDAFTKELIYVLMLALSNLPTMRTVAFSPDGRYIVVGGGMTIVLVDVKAKKYIHTFEHEGHDCAHEGPVSSVAFSPDGRYIVSGSKDNSVKLWDVETRELIHTFKGYRNWIYSAVFSRDNKYIAVGSVEETIKLWEIKTRKIKRKFKGHSGIVRSVTFSPDGKYLASGSEDTVKLWDIEKKKSIHTFKGYYGIVRSLVFSHDGTFLVAGMKRSIRVWDIHTKTMIHDFETNQEDDVQSIALSPDDMFILSCGEIRGSVKIWDTQSAKMIFSSPNIGPIENTAFSEDGKYVAIKDWKDNARFWSVERSEEVNKPSQRFSDGRWIFGKSDCFSRADEIIIDVKIGDFKHFESLIKNTKGWVQYENGYEPYASLNLDDQLKYNKKVNDYFGTKIIETQEEIEIRHSARMREIDIQNSIRIFKTIQQVAQDVPLQLTRLAQLVELTNEETELKIIEILSQNPELGKYLSLEQVFIKESEIFETTISRYTKPVDTLQSCRHCGSSQSVLIRQCTECNNELPSCMICKRGFSEGEPQISCPHCKYPFHKNHLLEYCKIKGECPVCKEKLIESLIYDYKQANNSINDSTVSLELKQQITDSQSVGKSPNILIYNGIELHEMEVNILILFENLVGTIIPCLEDNGENGFGFKYINNSITELYLKGKALKELPNNIGDLVDLLILDLELNKILSIPDSIGKLQNLKYLKISHNELSTVPIDLFRLINLVELDLGLNRFTALPEGFDRLINLKEIELAGNYLTAIPSSICNLENLEILNISHNEIIKLPDNIGNCRSLKQISISNNSITTLPDSFCHLTNLKTLDCSTNKLIQFPQEICYLSNLEIIDLQINQIQSLPKCINQLYQLNILGLQSNSLRSLPEEIGDLLNLSSLDLDNNNLEFIPYTIGNLHNLKTLKLEIETDVLIPPIIGDIDGKMEKERRINRKLDLLPGKIKNILIKLRDSGCLITGISF